MRSTNVKKLVVAALLCAVGIIIPMYSPVKIVLEPASFTLGSHIAIIIAMFVSPFVAGAVAVGTALGFFLAGFHIVIVIRAASHIVFALIGAYILQKRPAILGSIPRAGLFSLLIAVIHGVCEVLVVMPFYYGSMNAEEFTRSVILLVGVGTVVHSMVDFILAYVIWRALRSSRIL
ncbi:MAG: hypothetical protein ACOX7I_07280 [Oscillospiraceae bacterium]|jgi:niacin transporter